ncbi:MAG TPA: hypothetical protein VIV66_16175, partial [Pyrinomonadaceae bacterium]
MVSAVSIFNLELRIANCGLRIAKLFNLSMWPEDHMMRYSQLVESAIQNRNRESAIRNPQSAR